MNIHLPFDEVFDNREIVCSCCFDNWRIALTRRAVGTLVQHELEEIVPHELEEISPHTKINQVGCARTPSSMRWEERGIDNFGASFKKLSEEVLKSRRIL